MINTYQRLNDKSNRVGVRWLNEIVVIKRGESIELQYTVSYPQNSKPIVHILDTDDPYKPERRQNIHDYRVMIVVQDAIINEIKQKVGMFKHISNISKNDYRWLVYGVRSPVVQEYDKSYVRLNDDTLFDKEYLDLHDILRNFYGIKGFKF